jgi:hypothetical protein
MSKDPGAVARLRNSFIEPARALIGVRSDSGGRVSPTYRRNRLACFVSNPEINGSRRRNLAPEVAFSSERDAHGQLDLMVSNVISQTLPIFGRVSSTTTYSRWPEAIAASAIARMVVSFAGSNAASSLHRLPPLPPG